MKFKNNKESNELFPSEFTGILEWCDGAEYVYWISINHFKVSVRHREDGPAFEWTNGKKEWFLNGEEYSEEDWKTEVEKLRENRDTLVTTK
jgi:hypothetical protein